jgi:dUTP pyrophosphatase
MQVNSVGIIDQDYCGDEDTIKFAYINMRKEEVRINKGERIGQGMFVKIEKPEFIIVEKMEGTNRGGFGTTGIN